MKFFSALDGSISKFSAYILSDRRRAVFSALIIYTLVFLLLAGIAVFPIIAGSGTFLGADGIAQYYPYLMDFRSNTIDFIESVKSGDPQLTMMNFEFFFGNDSIASTTFMFVPFLPYYFCSAFVSEAALPMFYAVGVVLLSYIAGLSFMYLCSYYRKNILWSGLFAAFYVFCGNYFYTAASNPHFLYMYIAFPLMIVGMDRIITGRGCALFVLSVAWTAFSGIPFLIYTLPFVVIFAVIRVYFCYKGHFWRNLGKYFLRGSLLALLGIAMTSVPILIFLSDYFTGMRSSDGAAVNLSDLLMPSLTYFTETFVSSSCDAATGVSTAIIPCFLYVITSYSSRKQDKVFGAVMMLLVISPFVRYGINVFQYDMCRWGFVPAAFMCFCVVSNIPRLLNTSRTERGMFLFTMLVYALGVSLKTKAFPMIFLLVMMIINAVPFLHDGLIKLAARAAKALTGAFRRKSAVLLAVGGVLAFGLIIAVILILEYRHYIIDVKLLVCLAAVIAVIYLASVRGLKAVSAAALAVTLVIAGGFYVKDPSLAPYKVESAYAIDVAASLGREENTFGRTADLMNDCVILQLDRSDGMFGGGEEAEENEETDKPAEENAAEPENGIYYYADEYLNKALRFGIAEPAVFKSTVNGDFMRFMSRCGQDSMSLYSQVDTGGFSAKEVMYSLFGVDKAYSRLYNENFYGISPIETRTSEDGETVYIYENKYALPAGVTYDRYTGEKEFLSYNPAELPFAMMDSVYLEGYETAEYNGKTYSEKCDFSIRQESRGETSFGIECFDNYVTIESDVSDCFVYINFEGVRAATYPDGRYEVFSIETGEHTYNYYIHNSNGNWPWQYSSDSYTLSIGFREENPGEIYFITPFEFETMNIYAIPEEVYISAYEERTAEILENVEMTTNTLTGDITVSSDRILSVNMLYSTGWTAYVDGEEAPVYKANGLFLGIPINEGTHSIKLVYRSPWLYEGLTISAAAAAVFIIILVIGKRKRTE